MTITSARRLRWKYERRNLELEAALKEALGIHSLAAAVLAARGYTDTEEAHAFLHPQIEHLHDARLLPDFHSALDLIMAAKKRSETVYVHGDYDVDGVTSAAIWTRSLRKLGFDVVPHVPHRLNEGYGIHEIAVREAHKAGAKLFLTCDCGSSAYETVALAKSLGMKVVVTDHHQLGEQMPAADAIVNPHRKDSTYPFPFLSGAGVTFKMAQAVSEACGVSAKSFQRAYLDLVCLGTIADVVPLIGENRVLAKFGLERLAETNKVGLRALLAVAEIKPGVPITSRNVGFQICPRLNAAGRIADADESLQILLTDDPQEAERLAKSLDAHNQQRKDEQNRILEHADQIIRENGFLDDPLLFVFAPDWHVGVIGIVAGKLKDRYFRPVLVASVDEQTGIAKGSARSTPMFHLYDALHANASLFHGYGGHAMAAGFSIAADRLEEAREELLTYSRERMDRDMLIPTVLADAEIGFDELDFDSVAELSSFAPYGEANPSPLFIMRSARVSRVMPTRNPDHAMFELEDQTVIRGVAFGIGNELLKRECPADMDLLIALELNEWNGRKRVQVELKDFS